MGDSKILNIPPPAPYNTEQPDLNENLYHPVTIKQSTTMCVRVHDTFNVVPRDN